MATKQFSRTQKAMALVPVALLSGAWTASLAGVGQATAAGDHTGDDTLPDGTSVPSQAIQAPANVPQAGIIAPGVPTGAADSVVDSASTSGIPSSALSAYQRAAQIIDSADKTCKIPWQLIAAIGRVESDHGRYGGNVLSSNGVSEPGIYGPELDGKNGTQAIQDTDGGALDDDQVYDRAVGPMQFIPSTWQVVKVDADGDGKRNPQDIDDASLATAVYLCSGDEDLSVRDGQEKSVYRYNHSQDYVDLVLRLMEAYMAGDYTAVPDDAYGGTTLSYDDSTAMNDIRHHAQIKKKKKAQAAAAAQGSSTTPGGTTTNPGTGTGVTLPGTTGSGTGGLPHATSDPVGTVTGAAQDPVGTVGGVVQNPVGTVKNVLTDAQATLACTTKGYLVGTPIFNQCVKDLTGK